MGLDRIRRDDGGMITTTTLVTLLATLGAAFAPPPIPHPHVPKAIVVGGAAGKAKVMYFTVPYNAKHLEKLEKDFQWHLGFAHIETEFELKSGDVTVPKGRYKVDVRRGDGTDDWSMVLVNGEWAKANQAWRRAQFQLQRGRGTEADVEKAEAALEAVDKRIEAGELIKEHVLAMRARKGDEEEHLAITALHRGYTTPRVGLDEPAGGVEFSLRIDFGNIHQRVDFAEVFDAATASPANAKKEK